MSGVKGQGTTQNAKLGMDTRFDLSCGSGDRFLLLHMVKPPGVQMTLKLAVFRNKTMFEMSG